MRERSETKYSKPLDMVKHVQSHNYQNGSFMIYYLLTESEVITGKPQTEALMYCIDRAIARSIHQGRGLRFPCNDRTDEVNKLFIIWPFYR